MFPGEPVARREGQSPVVILDYFVANSPAVSIPGTAPVPLGAPPAPANP